MASELRVDTLKDSSGNNSVGMSYVSNGSAKAWAFYKQYPSNSVPDSLNVSSLTDNGSGIGTLNWTSSFSAAEYAYAGQRSGSSNNTNAFTVEQVSADIATGSCKFCTKYLGPSSITVGDSTHIGIQIHGDLA